MQTFSALRVDNVIISEKKEWNHKISSYAMIYNSKIGHWKKVYMYIYAVLVYYLAVRFSKIRNMCKLSPNVYLHIL